MKLKIRKWISEKRWYILAFAIPFCGCADGVYLSGTVAVWRPGDCHY